MADTRKVVKVFLASPSGLGDERQAVRSVITEFKLFNDRGHSLIVDHGWREVADYTLVWLNKNGL